jgi:hypothetical protein
MQQGILMDNAVVLLDAAVRLQSLAEQLVGEQPDVAAELLSLQWQLTALYSSSALGAMPQRSAPCNSAPCNSAAAAADSLQPSAHSPEPAQAALAQQLEQQELEQQKLEQQQQQQLAQQQQRQTALAHDSGCLTPRPAAAHPLQPALQPQQPCHADAHVAAAARLFCGIAAPPGAVAEERQPGQSQRQQPESWKPDGNPALLWWYLDGLDGPRGPHDAARMLRWATAGVLDDGLQVAGVAPTLLTKPAAAAAAGRGAARAHDKQLTPPLQAPVGAAAAAVALPPPLHVFRPLRELLEDAAAGRSYDPVLPAECSLPISTHPKEPTRAATAPVPKPVSSRAPTDSSSSSSSGLWAPLAGPLAAVHSVLGVVDSVGSAVEGLVEEVVLAGIQAGERMFAGNGASVGGGTGAVPSAQQRRLVPAPTQPRDVQTRPQPAQRTTRQPDAAAATAAAAAAAPAAAALDFVADLPQLAPPAVLGDGAAAAAPDEDQEEDQGGSNHAASSGVADGKLQHAKLDTGAQQPPETEEDAAVAAAVASMEADVADLQRRVGKAVASAQEGLSGLLV